MTLSNNLGQGEFSLDPSNWIPVNQITFDAGVNTKNIYYKGKQGGIHMLSASSSAFNIGAQNLEVKDNVQMAITSTNNLFGVNKPGLISYALKDISTNPVTFTKDIYIDLSNNSSYGRFVADPSSMTSLTKMKVAKNTSMGSVYYRNSLTGDYNITLSREGFTTATYGVTVKNQLTFANVAKTVSYGEITSKYNIQMLAPQSQSGSKAKGAISYTGLQPNDGDILTIDQVTFEFDTNGSITVGRVSVGLGDVADNTWKNLVGLVNSYVPNVFTVIDTTSKTVFIEAKTSGNL